MASESQIPVGQKRRLSLGHGEDAESNEVIYVWETWMGTFAYEADVQNGNGYHVFQQVDALVPIISALLTPIATTVEGFLIIVRYTGKNGDLVTSAFDTGNLSKLSHSLKIAQISDRSSSVCDTAFLAASDPKLLIPWLEQRILPVCSTVLIKGVEMRDAPGIFYDDQMKGNILLFGNTIFVTTRKNVGCADPLKFGMFLNINGMLKAMGKEKREAGSTIPFLPIQMDKNEANMIFDEF